MKKRLIIYCLNCIIFLFILTSCESANNDIQESVNQTEPKKYANFDKNADKSILLKEHRTEDENGNVIYDEELMRKKGEVTGHFITINDFDVETDDTVPLRYSKLDNKNFHRLLAQIDGTNWSNSDSFRLFFLIEYDEWLDFRETTLDSEQCYYCIFENVDDLKKVFLFFRKKETTWHCTEYMVLDSNGKPVSLRDSEYSAQTERPEELMKLVNTVDLKT